MNYALTVLFPIRKSSLASGAYTCPKKQTSSPVNHQSRLQPKGIESSIVKPVFMNNVFTSITVLRGLQIAFGSIAIIAILECYYFSKPIFFYLACIILLGRNKYNFEHPQSI